MLRSLTQAPDMMPECNVLAKSFAPLAASNLPVSLRGLARGAKLHPESQLGALIDDEE